MGNWRTVHIVGTCPPDQVDALRAACDYGADGRYDERNYAKFHCLSMGEGLCGLGYWVGEHMDVSGNLAERDYGVDDVVEQLQELVKVAPGLKIKVHCGDDWESHNCIATITVANGHVERGEPETEYIRGASEDEVMGRFTKSLTRQGFRLG